MEGVYRLHSLRDVKPLLGMVEWRSDLYCCLKSVLLSRFRAARLGLAR